LTTEEFRGSRQYYQKEYSNCMTITNEFGPVDLLITLTMDPECDELEIMMRDDDVS